MSSCLAECIMRLNRVLSYFILFIFCCNESMLRQVYGDKCLKYYVLSNPCYEADLCCVCVTPYVHSYF